MTKVKTKAGETQEFILYDGLIFNTPKIPKHTDIVGYGLPKEDQCFTYTNFPSWFDEERKEEKKLQKNNKEYFSEKLNEFILQEWKRRLQGYWFFNNGVPTYITGKHYFYLNYCKIDISENGSRPYFYISDMEEFYAYQIAFDDDNCLGTINLGSRGTGKTLKVSAIILEHMTRPPRSSRCFIQSKTEIDAKRVIFQGKLVGLYKSLPYFFRPVSDISSNPKEVLRFVLPQVKGVKASELEFSDETELNNTIHAVTSTEVALDGETASLVIQDEIFKTTTANVQRRLEVNRFVVFRNSRKVGVILCTSTVEDMGDQMPTYEAVWKEADIKKRTTNGYTNNGLYRYFVPCYKTTRYINGVSIIDKYGFVDEEKAKEYHQAERFARKDSPNALSSYIRKNPYSPEEAFSVDTACQFDSHLLVKRRSYLETHPRSIRGNFVYYQGNENNNVIFEENPEGIWEVSKLLSSTEANKVSKIYDYSSRASVLCPDNMEKFVLSADPVDAFADMIVDVGQRSKASCVVFAKLDYWEDDITAVDEIGRPLAVTDQYGKEECLWKTHNFCALLAYRPNDPTEYYDEIIKACRYYGGQVLIENQKIGAINYINQNGYGKFLMKRPTETVSNESVTMHRSLNQDGSPSTKPIINLYIEKLKNFVKFHGHRIDFIDIINDLLKLNPRAMQKYDIGVACGFALIASDNQVTSFTQKKSVGSAIGFIKGYKRKA
jgi:hypothetical protein